MNKMDSSPKFKVGDIVKVKVNTLDFNNGQIFMIDKVEDLIKYGKPFDEPGYRYIYSNYLKIGVYEKDLVLHKVASWKDFIGVSK